MLKRQATHALKALLAMAQEPARWRSVRDLATSQELPAPMLEQLLLRLRRAGLVVARRGRRGGYRLARSPQAIPLAAILAAVDSSVAAPDLGGGAEDQVLMALQRRLHHALTRELAHLTLEELLFDLRSTRAALREEGGLLLG
jgi:Rrf2 family protein